MKMWINCRRWGHPHALEVKITGTGWWIGFMLIAGKCDPRGHPYLFKNLDHDTINYPADLGGYMEFLWRQAKAKKWTDKQIQPKINAIGRWISKVEGSSPKGIWETYN